MLETSTGYTCKLAMSGWLHEQDASPVHLDSAQSKMSTARDNIKDDIHYLGAHQGTQSASVSSKRTSSSSIFENYPKRMVQSTLDGQEHKTGLEERNGKQPPRKKACKPTPKKLGECDAEVQQIVRESYSREGLRGPFFQPTLSFSTIVSGAKATSISPREEQGDLARQL